MQSSESPPATIPAVVLETPYKVIHNTFTDLTCPLDSEHNFKSAREKETEQSRIPAELRLALLYQELISYISSVKGNATTANFG